MVELVPAVCPKCGANLQLPDNLEKAHCMYCGTEIIIEIKRPDVHYHGIGTVENYLSLLDVARKGEKYEEALHYANRALEIDAKSSIAWLRKGEILLCSGMKKEDAFSKLISVESAEKKLKLGEEACIDFVDSINCLKRSLDLNKNNYQEVRSILTKQNIDKIRIAWSVYAPSSFKKNRNLVEELYDTLLAIEPNNAKLWMEKGDFCQWYDTPKAKECWTKAVEIDPVLRSEMEKRFVSPTAAIIIRLIVIGILIGAIFLLYKVLQWACFMGSIVVTISLLAVGLSKIKDGNNHSL